MMGQAEHGTEGYFAEHARNLRRLSALSAILACALLGLLLLTLLPPLHRAVRDNKILRAGFAGRTNFLERVLIATGPGSVGSMRNVGRVVTHAARRDDEGFQPTASLVGPRTEASRRTPDLSGVPEEQAPVRIRADVRREGGAEFQSEDLVIIHMVMPDYPEDVWGRGIAGRVTAYVEINALGSVDDVHILHGLHPRVDEAVRAALLQYRFQAPRENGQPVSQQARLTFNFTL